MGDVMPKTCRDCKHFTHLIQYSLPNGEEFVGEYLCDNSGKFRFDEGLISAELREEVFREMVCKEFNNGT